jgi:hypothetical protein
VAFHQPERIELTFVAGIVEGAEVAPVDFAAFASCRFNAHEGPRPWLRPDLAGVLTRTIRWDLGEQQYDEMVKSAVGLKDGTATARMPS